MHGEEEGCIAECPCGPEEGDMYCWALDYCYDMAVSDEELKPYCICMNEDGS